MPSARALRFGKAVIELALISGDVEKQLNRLQNKMRDFGKGLRSIGTAGLKISGTLTGLFAIPVKLAADFEKTRAEFTAMIGDAAKADAVLSQLQQFALETPLGMGDLSEATRTLLSFGVAVENVVPTLKRLGEIAGGDNERMKRLALAFGQVNAKGRLMAQEVNQMVEAGFNPLQEISRTTGESMKSLMARMEAGGLTVQEVANAFRSATGTGGRFRGLLEAMGKTTVGKFNNLKESFFNTAKELGKNLLPDVNEFLDRATALIPKLSEWVKNNKELIKTVAKAAVVVGTASAAIVSLGVVLTAGSKIIYAYIIAIHALRAAFTLLATHPIVAAIIVIIEIFALLHQEIKNVNNELDKLNNRGGRGPKGSWMEWSPELSKIHADQREAERQASGETPFKTGGSGAKGGGIVNRLGGFLNQGLVEARAASLRAQFEALPIGGMLERAKEAFEKNREWAEEAQRLDDETARARIDGMRDGLKKELALLDLEKQLKTRELQAAGQLTPEMQAKLDALFGAKADAARRGDLFGSKETIQQQGIFDARFAAQIFGGSNEQTELLRGIKRNTDPKNQRAHGIPVL